MDSDPISAEALNCVVESKLEAGVSVFRVRSLIYAFTSEQRGCEPAGDTVGFLWVQDIPENDRQEFLTALLSLSPESERTLTVWKRVPSRLYKTSTTTYLWHYKILDLPATASIEQIEAKARFLRAAYHPDKFHQFDLRVKQEAEDKFKAVNVALDELRLYWKAHGKPPPIGTDQSESAAEAEQSVARQTEAEPQVQPEPDDADAGARGDPGSSDMAAAFASAVAGDAASRPDETPADDEPLAIEENLRQADILDRLSPQEPRPEDWRVAREPASAKPNPQQHPEIEPAGHANAIPQAAEERFAELRRRRCAAQPAGKQRWRPAYSGRTTQRIKIASAAVLAAIVIMYGISSVSSKNHQAGAKPDCTSSAEAAGDGAGCGVPLPAVHSGASAAKSDIAQSMH